MCVSDILKVYVELPTNSDGLPEKTSFLWSLLSSISALALQRSLPFGKAESESFEEGNDTSNFVGQYKTKPSDVPILFLLVFENLRTKSI